MYNPKNRGPQLPQGVELGQFENYADVSVVINKLGEAEFPLRNLVIIGNDLKNVEQVTGRQNYLRSAIKGATNGLWFGLLYSMLMIVLDPNVVNGSLIFAALLIGAGAGGLLGLVFNLINKRRKGFTSVSMMLATSFVLIVAPEFAEKARQILGQNTQDIPPTSYENPPSPSGS